MGEGKKKHKFGRVRAFEGSEEGYSSRNADSGYRAEWCWGMFLRVRCDQEYPSHQPPALSKPNQCCERPI